MSGFGSFSQDAYEQLKEAYAQQLFLADEAEKAGVKIGQDTLGVETAPIKSVWLDKTGLWKYPDGKGAYTDTEQKQQDLLAALRNEEGEIELPEAEQELDLDGLSEEELDSMIDEILNEIEGEGESGEEEDEDEEEGEGEEEPLSEEELNALIDEVLAEDDKDEEPQLSAADISARISELKAELASLSGQVEEEEEKEEEYEPEGTQGAEEETDSEDEPVEEEEVASNDEPA